MSNRGDFVGTAPTSGNYIPAPVPSNKEDLPVYVNDELLRLGGTVNGVLEGGALPPHSALPKRVREGMIMNFSQAVGNGVDGSGVWLYKKGKWWKLIDDPTTITDEIYEVIDDVERDVTKIEGGLEQLNADLDALNNTTLPALEEDLNELEGYLNSLDGELDVINNTTLPGINEDLKEANLELSKLEGKFPIGNTDIKDDSISTPKLQANSVNADKIVANSITGDKIVANTITGDKIKANTIEGDKIVANTINGNRIIANTINGNKIVANTLSGDKLIGNSISGDKIIGNSIGAGKIQAGVITGNEISASTKIKAGSGNLSATLDGADPDWRIYAGDDDPMDAPFRVDKKGNLFAEKGHFAGNLAGSGINGIRFKIGSFPSVKDNDELINISTYEGRIYDVPTGTYASRGTTEPFTTLIGVSLSHMGPDTSTRSYNFPIIKGANLFEFDRVGAYDGTQYFSFLAFGI